MNPKIKMIVAETHEIYRKSLVSLLQSNSDIDVIADASNGRELLEQLKKMKPDIVLLETEIPEMNTKETLRIMKNRFPEVKLIILSGQGSSHKLSDFMVYGAKSFLNKASDINTLFLAIQKVYTKGYFFDDVTSKVLMDIVIHEQTNPSSKMDPQLNSRETEILKEICEGNTNKEIAFHLHLSTSTIDFYRTRIYHKTKCNNAARLVKYAFKNGLLEIN